ncbi:hypothetical protein GCM10010232_38450 [Streptomyces amakusaensis]
MVGQRDRGRVVEDQGGRQGQPGLGDEQVAQFDGGERVEAEVTEGTAGLHHGGARVPQYQCGVRADRVQQQPVPFGPGSGAEGVAECGGRGVGVGGLRERFPRIGEFGEQGARARGDERRSEQLPVDVGDAHSGLVVVDGARERPESDRAVHHRQTTPPQELGDLAVGGHADLGPRSPGDRGSGQAPGPAVLHQSVEEGVPGGVGALSAAAPGGGDGGEDDEQIEIAGEFVEQRRAGDLGAHHLGDLCLVGVHQAGRHSDAGGVDHAGERELGRYGGQCGGQ